MIGTKHFSKEKKREILVVSEERGGYVVYYIVSNKECWYSYDDFKRIFKKTSDE